MEIDSIHGFCTWLFCMTMCTVSSDCYRLPVTIVIALSNVRSRPMLCVIPRPIRFYSYDQSSANSNDHSSANSNTRHNTMDRREHQTTCNARKVSDRRYENHVNTVEYERCSCSNQIRTFASLLHSPEINLFTLLSNYRAKSKHNGLVGEHHGRILWQQFDGLVRRWGRGESCESKDC